MVWWKRNNAFFIPWLENTNMIAPSGGHVRKRSPLWAVEEQLTLTADVRVETVHWWLYTVTYRIFHRFSQVPFDWWLKFTGFEWFFEQNKHSEDVYGIFHHFMILHGPNNGSINPKKKISRVIQNINEAFSDYVNKCVFTCTTEHNDNTFDKKK